MIVLFDGLCNLCDRSVRFLLRHDRDRQLKFAAIQSEAGRKLLASHGIDPDRLDTFVVIDGERCLNRSDAVLALARVIGMPWSLLGVWGVMPRGLRDATYRLVAANRYAWFGRRGECAVPSKDLADRFL